MVCLELYKAVQPGPKGKPVEAYRNTFANLALPLFAMAEPIPPKVTKYNGLEFSLWDRWTLEGDLTVREVSWRGFAIRLAGHWNSRWLDVGRPLVVGWLGVQAEGARVQFQHAGAHAYLRRVYRCWTGSRPRGSTPTPSAAGRRCCTTTSSPSTRSA